MDLYSKLATTMEELSSTFGSRMAQYEEDLKSVGGEGSHKSISSLSRDFTEFKGLIWKSLGALKLQMELLCLAVDRHEMSSRRKVLLLHGLKEDKSLLPLDSAVEVLNKQLKLPHISSEAVQVCHRLGANINKPRPLLIRFRSHEDRSEVWRSKTALKGTGLTLSEFLTKPRHDVFVNARKHFGLKQCWTADGRVVIMLPDKSRHKVESATELRQLQAQFPGSQSASGNSAVGAATGSRAITPQPAYRSAITSGADKRPRRPLK